MILINGWTIINGWHLYRQEANNEIRIRGNAQKKIDGKKTGKKNQRANIGYRIDRRRWF